MNTTSIVLAGGRGSRLGREKHAETVAGRSLIGRVIDRLVPLSTEILIVISQRQSKASFSSYSPAKLVVDICPRGGPLGGIYTGLVNSSSFSNVAVACDMPFLNSGLLRHMIGLAPGFDVVLPRMGHYREPLHAVYTKDCLEPMEDLIRAGDCRIGTLFDRVRVRYVEKEEMESFDPEYLSFFNVNTKADLERARALASHEAAISGQASTGVKTDRAA